MALEMSVWLSECECVALGKWGLGFSKVSVWLLENEFMALQKWGLGSWKWGLGSPNISCCRISSTHARTTPSLSCSTAPTRASRWRSTGWTLSSRTGQVDIPWYIWPKEHFRGPLLIIGIYFQHWVQLTKYWFIFKKQLGVNTILFLNLSLDKSVSL